MIRHILVTAALVSVAATAMAGLARMPASQTDGALSGINPVVLLQRLADSDKEPDSTPDRTHTGVPTSVRANIDGQPAAGSPTLLNTLAEGSPQRWSF